MIKKTIVFLVFFLGTAAAVAETSCVKCHSGYEGRLGSPVKLWNESIHKEKGVTCQDCHGGNPNTFEDSMSKSAGFIGVPDSLQIPALCAKCHADPKKMRQYNLRTDQYELYKTSIHGKRLLQKKDKNVATCVSCHKTHDIKSPRNPASSVYRTNLPYTCSKCHADKKLMNKYNLPSNQFEEYKKSYHGILLLEKNDTRPANCADCHGVHGATPPGIAEVANVCGNCHGLTEDYFNQSPHKKAVEKVGMPKCIDCHGNHNIRYPEKAMFLGGERGHCGSCHNKSSKAFATAQTFYSLISSAEIQTKEINLKLTDLKNAGIDISLLEQQINEVKAKIIEVTPLTHTLSIAAVQNKIKETEKVFSDLKAGIDRIQNEISNRKKIFVGVIFGILILIALLIFKLRSVSENER